MRSMMPTCSCSCLRCCLGLGDVLDQAEGADGLAVLTEHVGATVAHMAPAAIQMAHPISHFVAGGSAAGSHALHDALLIVGVDLDVQLVLTNPVDASQENVADGLVLVSRAIFELLQGEVSRQIGDQEACVDPHVLKLQATIAAYAWPEEFLASARAASRQQEGLDSGAVEPARRSRWRRG